MSDELTRMGVGPERYEAGLPANPTPDDLLAERIAKIMFRADYPDEHYEWAQPAEFSNRHHWHYARALVRAGISLPNP